MCSISHIPKAKKSSGSCSLFITNIVSIIVLCQDPGESTRAEKVHEEHKEEQPRARVKKMRNKNNPERGSILHLTPFLVFIITPFKMLYILVHFGTISPFEFQDCFTNEDNIVQFWKPGASWSMIGYTWITNATSGTTCLDR